MNEAQGFDVNTVTDALHAVQEGTMPAIMRTFGQGLVVALLMTLVTYTLHFVTTGGLTSVINSQRN